MSKTDTKQQILDIALASFGEKGYLATSIRDICNAVGIKESALYYHFRDKENVLHHLVQEARELTDKIGEFLQSQFLGLNPSDLEEGFLQMARGFYLDFLNETRTFQLLNLLLREQRTRPDLGALYNELMFEKPVETQAEFFLLLVQWGHLKNVPHRELAFAYQSIFHFQFSRQIALGQSPHLALAELDKRIQFFFRQNRVGRP